MSEIENKKVVQNMYEIILNKKELNQSKMFVDKDYVEHFNNTNQPLFKAFPDIEFTIKEIFGDNNKVITVYTWSGTHLNPYKNIPKTGKKITVDGVSIYELRNGKIIDNQAKPDKFSFFQQLGLIPMNFLKKGTSESKVYFVDEFIIPKKSYKYFKEKLDYNRNFIKNIDGFINDKVLIQNSESNSIINLTTIAIWENQKKLDNAKALVQDKYKKIEFNPENFNKEHNIEMNRGIFTL
ncbi:ester cyclase [Tenacibaculum sp. SDUM215027]|uniref:ester cyclase n=1 Tax=Tenacibaculum sp. SDUM215027 TaxID=3422596 RepID=UPI003D3209EB